MRANMPLPVLQLQYHRYYHLTCANNNKNKRVATRLLSSSSSFLLVHLLLLWCRNFDRQQPPQLQSSSSSSLWNAIDTGTEMTSRGFGGFVVQAYSVLNGVMVTPVSRSNSRTTVTSNDRGNDSIATPVVATNSEQAPIDLGKWLRTPPSPPPQRDPTSGSSSNELRQQQRTTPTTAAKKTLLIFGTYAADFNMIEYGQRLRYYLPQLQQEYGIAKCGMIINCHNSIVANQFMADIDLYGASSSSDSSSSSSVDIEVFIDPTGIAGKTFGVSRGWLPNNTSISPYIKLFGMLFGLGAYATLPAVISGYIGNPFTPQPWITDALTVGNLQHRWPMNALEITTTETESSSGTNTTMAVKNKFDDLPLVGSTWGRRPLELATLRLQSMMGISLAHWSELQPNDIALQNGILTQLGGCLIIDNNQDQTVLYDWKDPGICAVANFEDILVTLKKRQ